ncbi:MAG: aminoacyl-tRNA hydrolase [Bacteroidetes bacterium]|nr:aminoacyl-tRNA hydrolase [Bacteroidota bacterium]HET6245939.1 aminoacyl-tRNA hydrolase [Bacteroidia bacterium]
MKYLIAGLGNIGEEYNSTRHNIGFDVLDAFVKASDVSFKADKLAFTAQVKCKGRTLILIKPTTYMNLSGKAVNYYLQKEKIGIENLLVITDDISLPLGKLRLRGKGSDGGHNGLKSIIEVSGTTEFARLRFGVGCDFPKGRQVDFVLGKWNQEELKTLETRMSFALDLIKSFTTIGLDRTMSTFNNL